MELKSRNAADRVGKVDKEDVLLIGGAKGVGISNLSGTPLRGPTPMSLLSTRRPGRLSFLSFELLPIERQLFRERKPVDIGSRAFDLLLALVSARGRIVSKAEIFDHVWPSMTVEESNLRFQIATLRKALGSERDAIKTVQGRGYLFTADVKSEYPSGRRLAEAASSEATDAAPKSSRQQPEASKEAAHVAVVDDDDSTREALEAFLRCSGYSPICFSSAADFHRRAPAFNLSCLILDVWMPERTGLELQSDLRKSCPTLPIIFISGHADVHMSVRAMKAGAIEFLTKPVRHEELLAAVCEAVAASRHRAAALERFTIK